MPRRQLKPWEVYQHLQVLLLKERCEGVGVMQQCANVDCNYTTLVGFLRQRSYVHIHFIYKLLAYFINKGYITLNTLKS